MLLKIVEELLEERGIKYTYFDIHGNKFNYLKLPDYNVNLHDFNRGSKAVVSVDYPRPDYPVLCVDGFDFADPVEYDRFLVFLDSLESVLGQEAVRRAEACDG